MSDTDVADAIQHAPRWTAGLRDGTVDAPVSHGSVILMGSVACDGQRRAAENQVRQIKGVSWVDNRITLFRRVSRSAPTGSTPGGAD
ncbi:BON domain-containing protein [Herbiconiux sp. VKM Ac-1786]|uniref:BON domain-containing protein n=1 Tax=Herbiconiux sp. VKM Ac-1786 TaxID=2783824 RepID=UPI00188C795F|nr:BON domain-containing protein [Herbiconiux sp. VKM Ac-1786]